MDTQEGAQKVGSSDTFEELEKMITHYCNVLKMIEAKLPRALWIGRYGVQLDGVKSAFKFKISSIVKDLLLCFAHNFAVSAQS